MGSVVARIHCVVIEKQNKSLTLKIEVLIREIRTVPDASKLLDRLIISRINISTATQLDIISGPSKSLLIDALSDVF